MRVLKIHNDIIFATYGDCYMVKKGRMKIVCNNPLIALYYYCQLLSENIK